MQIKIINIKILSLFYFIINIDILFFNIVILNKCFIIILITNYNKK